MIKSQTCRNSIFHFHKIFYYIEGRENHIGCQKYSTFFSPLFTRNGVSSIALFILNNKYIKHIYSLDLLCISEMVMPPGCSFIKTNAQ